MTKELIEAIGSGAEALKQLGVVAEMLIKPMATRALNSAEDDGMVSAAIAETQAAQILIEARHRAELDEIRHYTNIVAAMKDAKEAIEDRAARNLLPEQAGKGESDPDWFHKWASYAKETSDQDIRALWAKVLAGEIIQPGSFSLRLLHTVNLLRKADAVRFHRFANYIWRDQKGRMFLLYDDATSSMLKAKFDGHEPWMSDFHELGLTTVHGILGSLYPKESGLLCYGGKAYLFDDGKLPKGVHSPVLIPLTAIGRELMRLCDTEPDQGYIAEIGHGAFVPQLPSPWPWPDVMPNY